MTVKIDDKAIAAINTILTRGGNALVYKSKEGLVIAEESRKIEYRTIPSRG